MTNPRAAGAPLHARFRLGSLVATPRALRVLRDLDVDVLSLIQRHVTGDFGDLCTEDVEANELAIALGLRVLSAYTQATRSGSTQQLWVVTEADRSVTTVLLPEEY